MAVGERASAAGLSKSCVLIIVVASVERFAYKGVASNLVMYLTDVVKLSTSSAAKTVSTWSGFTSMLPLVSAVLADSYWDRCSTITASSFLYVVGLGGLTLWSLLYAWMPTFSLYLPLYLISIGQAGYNPSLQAFGADQLEIEDELPCCKDEDDISKNKSLFFQWWYFGICSGSLLGNSLMSYVQDTIGWGLGFAIPTIAMMLSVLCFLLCTRLYVHKKHLRVSEGMPYENKLQAPKLALKNIFSQKLSLPRGEEDAMELELQEKPLSDDFNDSKFSNKSSVKFEEQLGIAQVILRLFPVWMMLLMFAVIFQQPPTFSTKQGMAMNHTVGNTFVVSPAMLQSATTLSIILLMPVYDKLIIPVLRLVTQNDRGISVLQRIATGMLLSVLAMIVAAIVETKRLEINRKASIDMQLNILWLLPQYILLGVSDVFTVVGMQEFFYTQVPSNMRTTGISLYLSVFGVGSFLSAVLISVVEMFTVKCGKEDNGWFSDDMREAQLDKYYWLLALLSLLSFLMFASLCRYYDDRDASSSSNGTP